MEDFRKAYAAGRQAYQRNWSRWVILVAVVFFFAIEICRRHAVSWAHTGIVLAGVLVLFTGYIAIVERIFRHPS